MEFKRPIDINKLSANDLINLGIAKLVLETDKINSIQWLELQDSAQALTQIIEEELRKQSPDVKETLSKR